MEKTILIIDDKKEQAEGLTKALSKGLPKVNIEYYYEEENIMYAIEHRFYTIAIVDIRMDDFNIDGIHVVKEIFKVNPFAKVIIVSAFKDEYFAQLKEIFLSGKVLDVLEKENFKTWIPKLEKVIIDYYQKLDADPSEINGALLQFYAEAKNEKDTYIKGERFEHFISLLFQSFGYKEINKRIKDISLNEVDLIIRNEIDDRFLDKFGKYILVECKNKPDEGVSKNDFIVFKSKLKNTNGLAEFGVIATSGYISRNTYHEALRDSEGEKKIVFLSNVEIEQLITSKNKKEDFKRIIDDQVKDN